MWCLGVQSSFPHMSTEQLVDQITCAGSSIEPDFIDAIQAHKREITPYLHALLAKPIPFISTDDTDEYARCHALIFLSSWGDLYALTIIGDVLRRHDDNLHMLYEYLEQTLPAYGNQAIHVLATVLYDDTAPQASRIAACTTLGVIANLNPLTTRSITKILRDILPQPTDSSPHNHELWSWVVVTLAELRSKAAQPQVNQLYQAGFLDPAICGRPDEFSRALNESVYRMTFQDPLTLYQY